MKTRTFAVIMTALLILSMVGSAMCAPTALPDQAATQAEKRAIDVLQEQIDAKGYNWTAGITSVSGLSDEEKKKLCGVKAIDDMKDKDIKENKEKKPKDIETVGTFPSTFDWRAHNGTDWMTSVKDQGICGSCWAFSALGVVEAAINIHANDPNLDIDLSEQHLVSDCCNAGSCGGGYLSNTFTYIRYTGVPEEACFPYIASNCACATCENWESNAWNAVSSSTYYQSVWKDRITTRGPLSAVIVVYDDLHSYTGGVYQHTTGEITGYHAITVVGWNDTEGCWIIKNSWGSGWGEDGYGRIPGNYFPSNYRAYYITEIGDYVPSAEATVTPVNGTPPLTVEFTGTGTDHDGTIVSYEWDFGDGTNSTSQNPTHTYTDLGEYTAMLTVTDDDGNMGFDSVVVTSGETTTPIAASASSSFANDYLPEKAIDGDMETYWLSGMYDDPCWIMFDFGEQVEFHSVYMTMHNFGSPYSVLNVSASNDATTWDIVAEDVMAVEFDMVKVVANASQARYVKLDFVDPNFVEGCCEFYAILEPSPCELYDTNNDCEISMSEMGNALDDWYADLISMSTLGAVLDCWNAGSYC